MLQITEDTPPDMLAGAMDLTVHLPTGRSVKMSVERSTPMMDLLVQITTNQHLQLSGYTLQALGMAPSTEHNDSILPYKPNTPIGALDTQHIRVVPKSRTIPVPKNIPPGHQPFESTFRLKVHLPRNQLFVTRVSQSIRLEDIMKKVCEEKNLDPVKYEFRHPANLNEVLDPKLTLSDYTITEIYLVLKGTGALHQAFSASDIMVLRKEEERKQMHNKTGGGVFNLIFRRGKSSSGSLSSENRSISPTHSDDSRSVTPPGVQQQIITPPPSDSDKPKPPQRKRRPAPKPPQEKTDDSKKIDPGLTICHSRNSSDSSGYHEASILSDNCNTSLPRRPKSTIINEESQRALSGQHSQSTSNLSKMSAHSKSTSSLALANRKKKAAPAPPPPVLKASSEIFEEPSPVVASQPPVVAQESTISTTNASQRTPFDSLISVQSQPPSSIESKTKEVEETIIPPAELPNSEDDPVKDPELDWQYQLPSPPKAFRDSSPVVFAEPNQTVADFADSVVTSPELFEKLKVIKDNQSEKETASDITSVVSEEEKPILNKLSLENLEKRKSLVYNRELATSLKMQDDDRKNETFSSSLTKFEKTYEEVKRSSPKEVVPTKSTLPNFKITTYDNPKQKIDIFEDDTIYSNQDRASKRNSFIEASSTLQRNFIGRSMENITFRKNSSDEEFKKPHDYKFIKAAGAKSHQVNVLRSESFSKDQTWVPSKPVTRSKSQVALNKYKENKSLGQLQDESLTKSNSLFDVSGLQSLGVMRLIQNKLNTPSNSTEQLDTQEKSYQESPEPKIEVQKPEEKQQTKPYQYRTPSINMGTWSDRPKIPVNVKEDPDYKFSVKDTNNSKLIVNTVNNDIKSHNSIEIKSNKSTTPVPYTNGINVRVGTDSTKNVSIKVNGSEPISSQNSGNVVIKIGGAKPVMRKPLGNVNENNQRPHSIALGSDFDISRVPVVKYVEYKKPYNNFQNYNNNHINRNTSITQIIQSTNNFQSNTLNRNSYKNTTETPINGTDNSKTESITINKAAVEPKPVFRVNSYVQNGSTPIVRGFKNTNDKEIKRMSWGQPQSFTALPAKPVVKDFSTNKPLPFSQANLRRTDKIEKSVPPPAPVMPKMLNGGVGKTRDNCGGDPKEQLLQAIRDFGGKKGLRAVKA